MIEIAIVEDEQREAELLERLLADYAKGRDRAVSVKKFYNPKEFLDGFNQSFDIVFLDICMPELSGMDVARRLREANSRVLIVFVTNMLQYAIEGYSVQASDFIVKPVNAPAVNRIMNRLSEQLDNPNPRR